MFPFKFVSLFTQESVAPAEVDTKIQIVDPQNDAAIVLPTELSEHGKQLLDIVENLKQEAIEKCIDQIGSRAYEIILPNENKGMLTSVITGCIGSNNSEQAGVAQLMNDQLQELNLKADVIFILGDINYKDLGISDLFERLNEIYGNPDLTNICNAKRIIIFGNHEFKIETIEYYKSYLWQTAHIAQGRKYLIENYKQNTQDLKNLEDLKNLFSEEKIKLEDLPPNVMPAFYNSYRIGNVNFNAIDSNHFPADTLAYFKNLINNEDNSNNQVAFFLEIFKQPVPQVILQHHQFEAFDKRKFKFDTYQYLNGLQVQQLLRIYDLNFHDPNLLNKVQAVLNGEDEKVASMPTKCGYDELISKGYEFFGFDIKQGYHAHNHALNRYGKYNCSGAGGGPKQEEQAYSERTAYYNAVPGCIISCINVKEANPDIYNYFCAQETNKVERTLYINDSNTPAVTNHDALLNHSEDFIKNSAACMETIKQSVIDACETLRVFFKSKEKEFKGKFFETNFNWKQNWKHTLESANYMNDLLIYVRARSSVELFNEAEYFKALIVNAPHPEETDNSLYLLIKTNLENKIPEDILSSLYSETTTNTRTPSPRTC